MVGLGSSRPGVIASSRLRVARHEPLRSPPRSTGHDRSRGAGDCRCRTRRSRSRVRRFGTRPGRTHDIRARRPARRGGDTARVANAEPRVALLCHDCLRRTSLGTTQRRPELVAITSEARGSVRARAPEPACSSSPPASTHGSRRASGHLGCPGHLCALDDLEVLARVGWRRAIRIERRFTSASAMYAALRRGGLAVPNAPPGAHAEAPAEMTSAALTAALSVCLVGRR